MNVIDQLKAVLCDPEGKCCVAGSDEDRAIVDRALEALAQPEQEPVGFVVMERQPLTEDQLFANDDLMALNATHAMQMSDITKIVRVIEAAHGIGDKT